MRMTETLLGQIQSHEIVRRWQFENPYTTLNQMVEQAKILKDYAEKRNKLMPPIEAGGIVLKDEKQSKDEFIFRGQRRIGDYESKKIENNSVLFYNSEGKGIKSISQRSTFEFFA